jgi:hypothetical protein
MNHTITAQNIEQESFVIMENLLWAARELEAGRELAVEGANYLCDAQDWLASIKGETK